MATGRVWARAWVVVMVAALLVASAGCGVDSDSSDGGGGGGGGAGGGAVDGRSRQPVPASEPTVAWTRSTNEEDPFADVAVDGDRVYVVDHSEDEVVAVDAATGDELWSVHLAGVDTVVASPNGEREVLAYTYGDAAEAVLLDGGDGTVRWRVEDGSFEWRPTWSPGHVSIVISDGEIGVFDRETGDITWSAGNVTLCSDEAAVALLSYDESTDRADYEVRDPATGEVLWSEDDAANWGCVPGGPVAGGSDGDEARDPLSGEVLFRAEGDDGLVVADGDRLWTTDEGAAGIYDRSGDLVGEVSISGRIFWDFTVGNDVAVAWDSEGGALTEIDLVRAEVVASTTVDTWADDYSGAHPVVGSDAVVVASAPRTIRALDLDGLAERWSVDLEGDDEAIDELLLAGGSVIVVLDSGEIRAYR